jgi:hypothetical protein
MIDNKYIDYCAKYYFTNGEAVPFVTKRDKQLINIYPITVKNYFKYTNSIRLFTIDRTKSNDAKIISMTYLQFLVDVVLPSNESYQVMFDNVFKMSLGQYQYVIGHDENNKAYIGAYKDNKAVFKIFARDFDNIVAIILHYNNPDYDSRIMSPDMQKAYEDYCKIKFKDKTIPTLEEKKCFVMSKTGYTLNQVNEMPYRHFEMIYNSCLKNDLYFSHVILQASEKYQVENLEHPLYQPKTDMFSFLQDADKFRNTVERAGQI